MSMTTVNANSSLHNANSTDTADAVATALASMDKSKLGCTYLGVNAAHLAATKADDLLYSDNTSSVWLNPDAGTIYHTIDIVDKDGMTRYVDNSEFLVFRKWDTNDDWLEPGTWLAENIKEVTEENKWMVTGAINGMYINGKHSLPATIRIYAILDMVIIEYNHKSYRFRYMKCDKDAFKIEFDKTIGKLLTKIIEFTEKTEKMADNFNKSLEIMTQGSDFET